MSQDKTLITHARTGAARFPGYEITVQHADRRITRGRRAVNGTIALRVPRDVIKAKSAPYTKPGKPEARSRLVNDDDHAIVAACGAEYRGLVSYYLLAGDVRRLNRVRWVMATSLLKTLACKYDSTVPKMAARCTATVSTPHGPRKCLQATIARTGRKPLAATFGGIPLRRQRKAALTDRTPPQAIVTRRKELVTRLQGYRGHRGPSSWPGNNARPSWSAPPATTSSTAGSQPRNPRSKSPESRMIGNDHVRFGGGPSGKGPETTGTSLGGLPSRTEPCRDQI
jgi:Type II intron maturase